MSTGAGEQGPVVITQQPVGDEPAGHVPVGGAPKRSFGDWHGRFMVAFGGAVLVVVAMLLGQAWTEGLRASSYGELERDIRDGIVQEWYVANSLDKGRFDGLVANQVNAQESGPNPTMPGDGTGGSPPTENGDSVPEQETGGIIVWRVWGATGWRVAASDMVQRPGESMRQAADPRSRGLVGQLLESQAPMRAFQFGDTSLVGGITGLGGFLLLAGLIFGAAPRVGTRWFWFWAIVMAPLFLGVIAYAVTELIGIRRRPDRPLDKRLPGIIGFVGSAVLGIIVTLIADQLRQQGVDLPL